MENKEEQVGGLLRAKKNNIVGKDITPFLLKTIVELTGGLSLESNIQLVLNNAALGAEIAKELSRLLDKEVIYYKLAQMWPTIIF